MQGAEGGAHSSTSEDKTLIARASLHIFKGKTIRIDFQIVTLKTLDNQSCSVYHFLPQTFTHSSIGGELKSNWTDTQSPPGFIHAHMATATIVQ